MCVCVVARQLSRYSNWLRAGRSWIESRWGRDFPPVQTGPEAHPASCKMGTGSFPGVKYGRGRAADHSPPSSAAVMEEYSYTSSHPLGHTGPVTGSLYLLPLYIYIMQVYNCMCDDVSNGSLTLILFETDNTEDDKRVWTITKTLSLLSK